MREEMSDQEGLSSEKVSLLPLGPPEAGAKKGQPYHGTEEESGITDEGQVKEDKEEMASSAHLEPSTLPWPGNKDLKLRMGANGVDRLLVEKAPRPGGEDAAAVPEPSEEEGSTRKTRSRWRESMPEGEKWRDDEVEVQHEGRGSGSLADDEDEEDDEEEAEEEKWISEKAARGFTPEVTIVRPSCKVQPEERQPFLQRGEPQLGMDGASPFYRQYEEDDDKYCKYPMI